MEQKSKTGFNDPSFLQYLDQLDNLDILKRKFSQFKETEFGNVGIHRIEQEFFLTCPILPFAADVIESQFNDSPIYRARKNIKGNLSLISTFSYPPAPVAPYGRANLENKSVFYGTFLKRTALHEIFPENGDVLYLSYWRINTNRHPTFTSFLPNDLPDHNLWSKYANMKFADIKAKFQNITESKYDELVFVYNEISNWFLSEEYPYRKTSWISNKYLFENSFIDFIVYPSYATNKNSCCLAINPNFVDMYVKFEKVVKYKINEINDKNMNYTLESIGEINHTNIEWREPLENEIEECKI